MNIALVGYGKMGQEIARLAQGKHTLTLIDPAHLDAAFITPQDADFSRIDVAIDFTHPSVVLANITTYCEKKVAVVVGTTGWHEHLEDVQTQVETAEIGFLYATNFSIGVNLFWETLKDAAKKFNKFEEYDTFGHEYHHNQKADSPSGTALTTAEILLDALDKKTALVTQALNRKIEPHELHFSSTRGGNIPGTHSVFFDSPADTIEFTHTARNRTGFASGALKSAEWLNGKTGFFTIKDFLASIL